MKIVAFEEQGGPHLGVVEGDQVIDLQAADPSVPADLGIWLEKSGGDTKALADIAKRAPASARRPLAGLTYALPVLRPGKIICLGLNYLEHVKEGSRRTIPRNSRPSFSAASPRWCHTASRSSGLVCPRRSTTKRR